MGIKNNWHKFQPYHCTFSKRIKEDCILPLLEINSSHFGCLSQTGCTAAIPLCSSSVMNRLLVYSIDQLSVKLIQWSVSPVKVAFHPGWLPAVQCFCARKVTDCNPSDLKDEVRHNVLKHKNHCCCCEN